MMATEEEKNKQNEEAPQNETVVDQSQPETEETNSENAAEHKSEDENESLKKEVEELKDKYLRLYSEFENFRRRTSKERIDLLKAAGEDILTSLLPVLDDFERAQKSMKESTDVQAIKEGVDLIHHKLFRTLEGKGLKPMESVGKEFNSELHEAITQSPAPSEDLKGKVIDEVEKGYLLSEKVIRYAKVIIGS